MAGWDAALLGLPHADHLPSPGVGGDQVGLHRDPPQERDRLQGNGVVYDSGFGWSGT
ncbi:hypothetical protein [Streptomyces sp. NBC_01320]|uniref:hypothetical protein n=1 Tax=Streptomyces sp. NBC_01320 TaxID=2903824 RepID=UPI002E1513E5|nr:hypothetical protein OG395_02790 [Streptomyces sp. NBC_01320]